MEHCQPKRPGDTTGAGRVWTDQGLARNGGDQQTCALVSGQTVGSGNKGFAEAERPRSEAGRDPSIDPNLSSRLLFLDVRSVSSRRTRPLSSFSNSISMSMLMAG